MRAFVLTGYGDMDKLVFEKDWPEPTPGPRQALVKVLACGLNNTDVNTRTGWYNRAVTDPTTGGAFDLEQKADATWGGAALTFPRIQGADVAGVVVSVGEEVDKALINQRVLIDPWMRDWDDPFNMEKAAYFGSEQDGGFADYCVVDARNIHVVHSDLADAELATFATSYITAENMLTRAQVHAGDVVLIPGASGGVGSALIQLARIRGAKTIAMCSDDKADAVRAIGADAVMPRAPEDLREALHSEVTLREVSVVADVVGGAMFPQFIDVLARNGRYTCAGAIAGPIVDLDLRTFYLKNLAFFGSTVIPPGLFADLVGYISRGEIQPLLAEVFPLEQLHEAQTAFIAKRHVGNIVVTT